jgi:hypothetical protein
MGLAHDTSYNLVVTLQEGYKHKLNSFVAFATIIFNVVIIQKFINI